MAGGGTVTQRGLSRGVLSRAFTPAQLRRAARDAPDTVFVDVDAEGYLWCGDGAAAAVARARPAPHVAACDGELLAAGDALQVRLTRALPPLHALRLWLDDALRARLDLPFLTLRNIRGRDEYECHECGARFAEPNPLKAHLFLRCAPPEPAPFWRRVASQLERAPAAAAASDAARLEALATAWGRARGGHVCLYCGKLYSRKYGLKIHLRTHTGYRPLRCRHCARAFGDPSNLNKHVRLHAAGAGAAACARCGKRLARRRDLERHLRTRCAAGALSPAETKRNA